MLFANRADAGRRLAEKLHYLRGTDVVVVGLPRGGVPVAFEVAKSLEAPLDVIVVRKLGVPYQPELAMGAIGEGGVQIFDTRVLRSTRVDNDDIAAVAQRERIELERRAETFRGERERPSLQGRTVIVVDDGIATGATMKAVLAELRRQHPTRLTAAVPCGPADTLNALEHLADEVVCPLVPPGFMAVGQWYRDFAQTTDDEVLALLRG